MSGCPNKIRTCAAGVKGRSATITPLGKNYLVQDGALGWVRTSNRPITSRVHYQLCDEGKPEQRRGGIEPQWHGNDSGPRTISAVFRVGAP